MSNAGESVVQADIIKYLKTLPMCQVERRQAGGLSYKMGIPDLWCVINSLHVEIEVKAWGETLDIMQEKYRDKCLRLGIFYIWSDNLPKVVKFFNIILNNRNKSPDDLRLLLQAFNM